MALERTYAEELTEDVIDRIPALLGSAMHTVIEQSGMGRQEERLYADILGWRISGQFDYLDDDSLLWDWKLASVWEVMHGVKDAREQQLNCYAHLARTNGQEVSGLRVGFVFRDWSKQSAKTEAGYPPKQVMVYPIPLWPPTKAEAYITERVRLHQEALTTLPECTDEDRWAQPDRWAVIKNGSKRASRVYSSRASADAHVAVASPSNLYRVEYRPGKSVRCESYCSASGVCSQWQKLQVAVSSAIK